MADGKIKGQHHTGRRFLRFPLSVCLFVPLCLSGQDPRSTVVETPLQIGPFFAKQSQFQNGQYKHKYSKNKGLCQKTTNNEQRTLSKTNPIKPNSTQFPRPEIPILRPKTSPLCEPCALMHSRPLSPVFCLLPKPPIQPSLPRIHESILQNKPNFLKTKTNATFFAAKVYEDSPPCETRKNKPNQTQFPRPPSCLTALVANSICEIRAIRAIRGSLRVNSC